MLKRFLITVSLLVFCFHTVAAAEVNTTPPTYCCGPTYSFCGALAHSHGPIVTGWGRPGQPELRGIVPSDCNTTGNAFFGNTLIVRYWSLQEIFWFDWPNDPAPGVKFGVWESTPNEPITFEYCQVCKMVLTATSPNT